jgi:hypothetical protein
MRKLGSSVLVVLAAVLLAGCVTVHGPTSFTMSREDIERNVEADLGKLIEVFRGVDGRRPEVAFMPVSGRLELAWYLTMPGQGGPETLFGNNVGVAVVMSGKPRLNTAQSGVDLTDVKVDDVRLLGLPRVLGFGLGSVADRKDMALPDMPLFTFPQTMLRRADVAYRVTAVEVTYRGLQVDIEPK